MPLAGSPGAARCAGVLQQQRNSDPALLAEHYVLHGGHRQSHFLDRHPRHRHDQQPDQPDHGCAAGHDQYHCVGGRFGFVSGLLLHLPATLDLGHAERRHQRDGYPGCATEPGHHGHRHQRERHYRPVAGLPVDRPDRHQRIQYRSRLGQLPRRGIGLCHLPAAQLQSVSDQ